MPNLIYGQVVVSGTRAALTSVVYENSLFILKASSNNQDPVYVGSSTVTTSNGHLLLPGEDLDLTNSMLIGSQRMDIRPNEIYVVGTTGDTVSWFGSYIP
jgi:hypothetical protein